MSLAAPELPRWGVLAAAALLAGCAALGKGSPAQDAPDAAVKPAYELEIVAPDELRPLLAQHLDLARFQLAPQTESISAFELDRLAAAAPAQARALLETEGYFDAQVRTERGADSHGLPRVTLRAEPGPRTHVGAVALRAVGDLAAADAAGDAAARERLEALRNRWPLKPGEPFRQGAWDDAKNQTISRLRAEGYPAASWKQTQARVDTAKAEASLELEAESGPLFRLGALQVEGLERYDRAAVERLAGFEPGTPYTERTLLDFQERLRKLGLFETASVEIDTDPARAEATPVTVRLREMPLQQATVGVGVSANTGPRITLEHQHRRIFGIPWIAKNAVELGTGRKAWQGDLLSHPVPGRYRNLVGGTYEWLRSGEELRRTGSARLGRSQDTERIERLYYLGYLRERLDNPSGSRRSQAVSINYNWVWRDLDSVLLPTDGVSLSAQVGGGYAQSFPLSDGPFGRLQGRITWYRPLGQSWYGIARLEAGEVFAKEAVGVPDGLQFRAGGDESVRGYAYRSLGPTRDGVLVSGRSLLTTSIELARPFSAKRPSLWGAVFVDAGNAANSFGELKPVVGSGFGIRWRSPVGPLRVDLAYGHEIERWRLHLSVGIAF
jgi:translocation and assembly module TamA